MSCLGSHSSRRRKRTHTDTQEICRVTNAPFGIAHGMMERVRGQDEAIAEIRRQSAAGLMRVNGKPLYRFHHGGGSPCDMCLEPGKLWWAFAESCNDLCYNVWQICSECENLSPFELDYSFIRPHHHNEDGSICWKRNFGLAHQDILRDGCDTYDECDSLLERTQAE